MSMQRAWKNGMNGAGWLKGDEDEDEECWLLQTTENPRSEHRATSSSTHTSGMESVTARRN
ncbi:hypothetical protein WN51_09058 [Melipona quadrifasciata]|uniref:Uncharacterized protein n=1 Tax=Melipona quadrifasciata TaxID=166423 RepID=A0A0M9A9I8_9HYME|nr:hypothetical protein WN51_09058 [Melipona quadrifasciata]